MHTGLKQIRGKHTIQCEACCTLAGRWRQWLHSGAELLGCCVINVDSSQLTPMTVSAVSHGFRLHWLLVLGPSTVLLKQDRRPDSREADCACICIHHNVEAGSAAGRPAQAAKHMLLYLLPMLMGMTHAHILCNCASECKLNLASYFGFQLFTFKAQSGHGSSVRICGSGQDVYDSGVLLRQCVHSACPMLNSTWRAVASALRQCR